MTNTYNLLIVGSIPPEGDLKRSTSSVQMFTCLLGEAFQEIGVPTQVVSWGDLDKVLTTYPTDIVLAHSYHDVYTRHIKPILLKNPTCWKLSASFMEVLFPVNLNFVFLDRGWKGNRHVTIPAPCKLDFLTVVPKKPGSILLDHHWLNGPNDWTRQIIDVLAQEFQGSREIAKLFVSGMPHPETIKILPKMAFFKYLEETAAFETFIVTHKGSYNATVIDMLARGIRVLSPEGFVPGYNIRRFGIQTFTTLEQMIALLKEPYNSEIGGKNRGLCTDMGDAVKIMDSKFKIALQGMTHGK